MKPNRTKFLLIPFLTLFYVLYGFGDESGHTIMVNQDIQLIQIADSFFVHTTWFNSPDFGRYPSNGLIYINNGRALMIDTPVNNELTSRLYTLLTDSMKVRIKKIIVGHFHDDCLGGLSFLHEQGLESYGCELTKQKCIELNLPQPENTFSEELIMDFEGKHIICRYFGGGHTIDNIVVYFPEDKILFGGCLIRSMTSKNLGNLQDAVVNEWDKTILKLKDEFKDIKYVIPGHGPYGGTELMDHTLELVKARR
ncbi:MAG: subclass B1 metallo-beta-lactamase [Calditrichaceae bacterium]|nr:subclass B1 metallo-beta-lactamase [Calditrichaceae bacterium]MBN2710416.1 subclass B1 metallo-beta-lactamase [Calditrichaceae bacterium]RQV94588.1 MAG: subclass B1 metallo-beta-lactamase [Calditrichota bacterium]